MQYFHDVVQEVNEPMSDAELAELVTKYVHPRRSYRFESHTFQVH